MWTWQPGVLMVGFTGIFLAIKITSDVYHGTTPEPIVFAGAVSMGVAGLMQVIPLNDVSFGVTSYSLTHKSSSRWASPWAPSSSRGSPACGRARELEVDLYPPRRRRPHPRIRGRRLVRAPLRCGERSPAIC